MPLDRAFPNTSEFIFGIKQDNLVFKDQTHDITWETTGHLAPFRTWKMIQFSMDFDPVTDTTEIMFQSDDVVDSKTYQQKNYAFFDNPHYHHFIGGIAHDFKLYNPFTGLIYELAFTQGNPGFFAANQSGASTTCDCATECSYNNYCPENCDPMEFWESSSNACLACPPACLQGCRRGSNCNVCDDSCSAGCTGYGSGDCL